MRGVILSGISVKDAEVLIFWKQSERPRAIAMNPEKQTTKKSTTVDRREKIVMHQDTQPGSNCAIRRVPVVKPGKLHSKAFVCACAIALLIKPQVPRSAPRRAPKQRIGKPISKWRLPQPLLSTMVTMALV